MKVLDIGAIIAQRWRVVGVARRGADSARLEAVTVEGERAVSIVQASVGEDVLSHLDRLAAAWKGARVEGLAPVLDVRGESGCVFVVSERVDGQTLAARLAAEGAPLQEPALLLVAQALCDVLERLHKAGFVSGAVAPDTVIVNDEAVLLELDPQRALRALARGRAVDVRVDVHGLGRVLRFAATGTAPPDLREGPGLTVQLAPMHAVNDSISATTERAVTQMLRTEPSRRPADVSAVRALLFPLAPRAPLTSPPSVIEPAAPPPPPAESAASPPPPVIEPESPPPPPAEPIPPPPPLAEPIPPAPLAPVVTTIEVPRPSLPSGASPASGAASRSRAHRRLSYGPATIAVVSVFFLCAAWVARLLYVVTDEVRVRVDPRSKPAPAKVRVRVTAPKTPYPATMVGSDGTVMLLVPEGEFPRGVPDPDQDDGPQISDTLPAYFIDRTEVTAAQFARFVQMTGWVARGPWRQYVNPQRMDLPVAGVTAEDAEEYAHWLGKRLPTEEEWEKAARGSTGRVWPWGNNLPDLRTAARFAVTSDSGAMAAPVASCPQGASPFGVLDMAGNVWEWTGSAYAPYSGSRAREHLFNEGMRVVRGGSWNTPLSLAVVTTRMPMPPRLWAPDVGFRCVLPLR